MERDFVHLHVHTEYSLLDGSGRVGLLVKRAKELGMKALAITDHGTMYGCVDFYKAAKEEGIKPIIGCEIYVAAKSMHIKNPDKENSTHHLVLLVKNSTGYENLMKIVSAASIDGFYYKPRVDHEVLEKYSEGLIALSACLAGEVQKSILKKDLDKARELIGFYRSTFKDGFYLELQNHGIPEQKLVNDNLIALSKEMGVPLVATNDIHYIKKEDTKAHDILMCIQTGKTIEDENRMRYKDGEFYLRSTEDMYDLFGYVKEALENTVKIANECNFDYEFHVSKLPNFPLKEGIDHYDYLKEVCYKGLYRLYEDVTDELKERLEYELDVISSMGFVDYFLITWDFIRFANENDIPTGPGRGSAAGSIVAYTLGITKIDPIKYGLIFERFLNPERVSMPDIDSDFCYERRQEVIDYVVEKYGFDAVAQIITFGTMAPRACIRDVGRAMDYSYAEVDVISKMIPSVLGITIDKALEFNPELKEKYDNDNRVRELIDVAKNLEGIPRHSSTHAAGVVIASKPLVNYVPLQRNEDSIVTQFTMTTLEELGLLKMDFLGLRTLTVLKDAVNMVKNNKGIDIDLDKIDFEDSKVYEMIGEGKTVGVFQLESPGMTSFMKDLRPDKFEDIIAGISLYRPGPMAEIPRYIDGKKNANNVHYETPELEPILNVTYGVMVYQEQVMQIVRDLAGYSLGRSDLVRRAMSKKKHSVMEQERKNFIFGVTNDEGEVEVPGCVRNGISEEAANKIFDQMMDFASYAFNKSHAAAYAVVGYQTAYMMKYHRVEFIAAMLNSVSGINEKVAYYIRFAKESGIEVLPPDINESFSRFTVEKETIRFGIGSVKNVGIKVTESIAEIRKEKGKFKNFLDFAEKVDTAVINKRAVESLIKCGAFDRFGLYRSQLLSEASKILDGMSSQRKKNIEGQMSLFQDFSEVAETKQEEVTFPNIKEYDKKQLLNMEKEMTGLYITGHPLDEYRETLSHITSIKTSEIVASSALDEDGTVTHKDKIIDGKKVIIGGILNNVSKKITRNNQMMAFLDLEDLHGNIEVIVFPKTFEKVKSLLNEDNLVVVNGRISIKDDEMPKLICENVSQLIKKSDEKIFLRVADIREQKDLLTLLERLAGEYAGNTPVVIFRNDDRRTFATGKTLWLKNDFDVLDILKTNLGEASVIVK